MGIADDTAVTELIAFALDSLSSLRHASGLYCYDRVWDATELRGESVRYSFMVLLGLQRAQAAGYSVDVDLDAALRGLSRPSFHIHARRHRFGDVGRLPLRREPASRPSRATAACRRERLRSRRPRRDGDRVARHRSFIAGRDRRRRRRDAGARAALDEASRRACPDSSCTTARRSRGAVSPTSRPRSMRCSRWRPPPGSTSTATRGRWRRTRRISCCASRSTTADGRGCSTHGGGPSSSATRSTRSIRMQWRRWRCSS